MQASKFLHELCLQQIQYMRLKGINFLAGDFQLGPKVTPTSSRSDCGLTGHFCKRKLCLYYLSPEPHSIQHIFSLHFNTLNVQECKHHVN